MLYQTKNPHGGDIYGAEIRLDFSANTNPLGTPQAVLDAVAAALGRIDRYPDPYCRQLVQAIARFEQVPAEYVFCGNGAAELIYSYCEAARPSRALELAPTFSEYSLGLERTGCAVDRYVLRREEEFRLSAAFLDVIERTEPEAVFLCNPNNPTGITIREELLGQIVSLCGKKKISLFVDECFLDLSDSGVSLKRYLAKNPRLFLLKAFTKSYGMAGIRLGYGMCSDAGLLGRMAKTVQPWNVSSLAQAAGIAALQEGQFLKRTKELIVPERKWLKAQLEALGLWVCPSETNYLLFCGPENLHADLIRRGISVRNCDNYPGLTSGWYRIAVRTHGENEELISVIKQCVKMN